MGSPYEGLLVLEIADKNAMYCGKTLAALGAEVIKIEKPGGDESRHVGPFYKGEEGIENSLSFASLNVGKKDITLDISSDVGKKIFLQLIDKADVLIETKAPGTFDSLDLGYDVLKKRNPGLIMLSVTPFGDYGPHSKWVASSDLIIDAMSGPMGEVGYIEKGPLHLGYDYMASGLSLYGLFAIQTAHHNRAFTGEGSHIVLSQQECIIAWRNQALGIPQVTGKDTPFKHTGPDYVRQALVDCKDGYAFVMIGRKWKELTSWYADMGLDISVFDDPIYQEYEREASLPWDKNVLEYMNKLGNMYTKKEFMDEGQRRHIPVGLVEDYTTMLDNEQLNARGFFVELDHPVIGKARYPGAPAILSESPYKIEKSAPLLGENNIEVYSGLGYSAQEVSALSVSGII